MEKRRVHYTITGQVQGVGFRPFIYRLALEGGLSGSVCNAPEGVLVEVQGTEQACAGFEQALYTQLPPLAKITSLRRSDASLVENETDFRIIGSRHSGTAGTLISPDMSICRDCLDDLQAGRRHDYPFTNCTNCGPRYSIIRGIPYDRPLTSMGCFPLCPNCQAEYDNPLDRRFHAQPNACPQCGPKVWLVEDPDKPSGYGRDASQNLDADALIRAAELLCAGKILAMKGLGGFHLICDAFNSDAVACLRQRKQRPHKALALMLPDLDAARQLVHLRPEDEALLRSPECPIVLCPKQESRQDGLPDNIAPDNSQLGIMLPYTPMQQVLFKHYRDAKKQRHGNATNPPALVMTSGNAAGQPLSIGNREALSSLRELADCFLLHDRDILIRVDDSVVAAQKIDHEPERDAPNHPFAPEKSPQPSEVAKLLFFRRGRGYVPSPIELSPLPAGHGGTSDSANDLPPYYALKQPRRAPVVLALGAELKATLCLTRGNQAFVSQHLGDLDNLETLNFQGELVEHFCKILEVRPDIIAHDLHPDFLSTRLAQELAAEWNIPAVPLQHHFAHARSLAAEHRLKEPCLCLTLDGTGYGDDGNIWGGELLLINPGSLEQKRLGSLTPLPLVGGDLAIREPWRLAWAALTHLGLEHPLTRHGGMAHPGSDPMNRNNPGTLDNANSWLTAEQQAQAPLLSAMLSRQLNTAWSSSCGRLFDAVSALCGLCDKITYEGQAAIRLENIQADTVQTRQSALPDNFIKNSSELQNFDVCAPYPLPLQKYRYGLEYILDVKPLFQALLRNLESKTSLQIISRSFHCALADGFAAMAYEASKAHDIKKVGLSGGCLQNQTLLRLLLRSLKNYGLQAFWPEQLPPGDGCVSLGQAAFARLKY